VVNSVGAHRIGNTLVDAVSASDGCHKREKGFDN